MVSFNCQEQFVPKILARTKFSTIRKTKRCNPGDTMQLFTGLRTKNCVKFAEAECTAVRCITISHDGYCFLGEDSRIRDLDLLQDMAEQEGFRDWADMVRFFQLTHKRFDCSYNDGWTFTGAMHYWNISTLKEIK